MRDLLRVERGEKFLNPRDGVMEILSVDPLKAVARLRHIPGPQPFNLPVIFGGHGDFAEVPTINSSGSPDFEEKRVAYRFPVIVWADDEEVNAA